jgi:hypothetical protein
MSRIKPSQPHAAPPEIGGQGGADIDREGQALEHGAVPA